MPATLIGSTEWNQRGLVLTRMDAQEQVTGLVNVQVEYVGPASKHDAISRSFYQDAPPPIWPSVVNRAELVTNRLYMESRTVTRANGLTTVNASYVGGLQRAGFRGYFLRVTSEPQRLGLAFNYAASGGISAQQYDPSGTLRNVDNGQAFLFDQNIKAVDYVMIGQAASAKLPTFTRADIATVRQSFRGAGLASDADLYVQTADLWIAATEPREAYLAGQFSFEQATAVPFTESAQYVTPTVRLMTRTYRLAS